MSMFEYFIERTDNSKQNQELFHNKFLNMSAAISIYLF